MRAALCKTASPTPLAIGTSSATAEPVRLMVRQMAMAYQSRASRTAVGIALAGPLVFVAACSDEESVAEPSPCQQLYADTEDRVGADGAVPGFASEEESTLVIKAQNRADDAQQLQVDVDAERTIDMELPGAGGCAHPPVFTFGLDLPAGDVEVQATSDGASSSEALTLVPDEPTWLVVLPSDGAVATTVSESRPVFG